MASSLRPQRRKSRDELLRETLAQIEKVVRRTWEEIHSRQPDDIQGELEICVKIYDGGNTVIVHGKNLAHHRIKA